MIWFGTVEDMSLYIKSQRFKGNLLIQLLVVKYGISVVV